jgi:4-azaleucine resistance transporter AzlC
LIKSADSKANKTTNNLKTMQFAFKQSIPILFGYVFIGIAFGLMLQKAGYHWLWAPFCSIVVYAGSLQYMLVALLTSGAGLLTTFVLSLVINGRQIFYGLSLLDRYKGYGKLKPYMIFSLTDETYSLLCAMKTPDEIDEKRAMFFVSIFNQIYWIIGSIIGALVGDLISFDSTGIEFAMTALFVVILIEYLQEEKNRLPALIGIISAILFLMLLSPDSFILPSICVSVFILIVFKNQVDGKVDIE